MRTFLKLLSFFLISISLFSCHSSKIIQQELGSVLQVESAFIQKEVPGMKDQMVKHYLNIQFSTASFQSVKIDSVKLVGGRFVVFSKEENNNLNINPLKIRLKKGTVNQKEEPIKAIIYYGMNEKFHYQEVTGILIEEPIYMP